MNITSAVLVAFGLIISLFLPACRKHSGAAGGADSQPNTAVIKWNETACKFVGASKNGHGLLASRIYAMMHIAMHDALNAAEPRFETYVFHEKVSDADPEVAAVTAAHAVLRSALPGKAGPLDAALNTYLATVPQSAKKSNGIQAGKAAAAALLAKGHNEDNGLDQLAKPSPAVRLGDYQVVPPFDFIIAPLWENAKLFSITLKDQFRSIPPPALNSSEYAVAFNEVQELGRLKSRVRTKDQTSIATFWNEDAHDGWNRIGRTVASNERLGLFATARMFALLNMAMADAYTAGWDSKQYYHFWRPFTAIRAASFDQNELTVAEAGWLPAAPTPPIQEYPSTGSIPGNAAAIVLAHVLGDNTTFTITSPTATPQGVARAFSSFSQAAGESANSAVLAGIHFRFSCVAGQEMGDKIGEWTVKHHLKPL